MAKVYEFLFRGLIEAENRGNTYHVILEIDGKQVGPLTASQAAERGFSIKEITSDIVEQLTAEIDALRPQLEAANKEVEELSSAKSQLTEQVRQISIHNAILQENAKANPEKAVK